MRLIQLPGLRPAAWIIFCCAAALPAPAKRLKPPAELVPPAKKSAIQVGSLLLHRCKDAPAYCGTLPRPLDPSGAVPGTINIGFQFYPHLNAEDPPAELIVATEGGPGYATTATRHDYVELFRPLMDRHDLLLVDDRGTGTSQAVNCAMLQSEPNPLPEGIAACGAQMGKAAYLYSGVLAAEDLAAVLDALGFQRQRIDLYGDSYGSYFSQIFATRHPERLRALVLDSSYPTIGLSPWYPEIAPTILQAFRLACERARTCRNLPGDSRKRIEDLVERLREHPFSGKAQDGEGKLRDVTANPANLAYMMFSNAMALMSYRELDAAARAYTEQGDSLPLLRLLAENKSAGETGGSPSVSGYSSAIFVAASCSDYPQLYDMKASIETRTAQRDAAFAEQQLKHPDVYAPFTIAEFNRMPLDDSVLNLCLSWPQAPASIDAGHPVAPETHFPDVPVLVLAGEFDTLTPWPQGEAAARLFPHAQFVLIKNSVHVTALGDSDNCGSEIVRRFVRDLTAGDTSCGERVAEVHLVPRFARHAAELEPANSAPGTGRREDLDVAAAAAYTLGDAFARWSTNTTGKGIGLRGGSWTYKTQGSHSVYKLKKVKWTDDVEVSGEADWDYNFPGAVKAHLKIRTSGGEKGELRLSWNSRNPGSEATISGQIGGREIRASMYAPI
jgi:pimeloyl-ACP methyl ester carboxylesterase